MTTTPAPSAHELALLARRLEKLEAESEIRRLVSTYHWFNDAGSASGAMPAWADLTVPAADGTSSAVLHELQVAGGAAWSGRGLSAAWPGYPGIATDDGTPRPEYMPRMMHLFTNEWIEVDGDTARGRWYCWEPAIVHIGAEPRAVLIAGRVRCEFRRADGTWRFSAIEFEEVFSTPYPGPRCGHVPYGPANARKAGT
ncbi:nuclear transport factor 2 family protein [Saccharopolyspora pogona]|uniref:nuclear transport factor 2 family protein n=1 Tax=Saccharopolyspora pogona TaxID=333966 RepID=UPI001689520D|nr:nuclear transport factor 2 family protein [Saccharopolyspora pogona]